MGAARATFGRGPAPGRATGRTWTSWCPCTLYTACTRCALSPGLPGLQQGFRLSGACTSIRYFSISEYLLSLSLCVIFQ